MNGYFLIGGILCLILGVVHSFLGERLIFKNKRTKGTLVPSINSNDLRESHLRIIWATWHLASIFGWCFGAILIHLAFKSSEYSAAIKSMLVTSLTVTMVLGSVLVLVGTKGKHPGWMVLLLIGVLTFFA